MGDLREDRGHRIIVDTGELPLLRITYDGAVDDNAFRAHLEEIAAVLARRERYVAVHDAMRAGVPTARQRRWQTEFIEDHHDDLTALCAGGAFALASPIIRGAMLAILWASPLPFEHTVVHDVATAVAWARRRIADA